jgi:hypothetical protein
MWELPYYFFSSVQLQFYQSNNVGWDFYTVVNLKSVKSNVGIKMN